MVRILFYGLSRLPLRVLYLFSDLAYFIVYYLVGYRKQVVMQNLDIAFPEKTKAEKIRIAKNFYHGFVDTFLETIKLISMPEAEVRRRITGDFSILHQLYEEGYSVQLHTGHFFNWEFLNHSIALYGPHTFLGVFTPISNKAFSDIMFNMRKRFGTVLIPATKFKHLFAQHAKAGRYALGLVADQSPGNPLNAYWYPLFGKMTAFVKGPEKGSRNMNTAVVMLHFYRVKRGYYRVDAELLTKHPNELPEGAITKAFVHFLEESIKKRPESYLWSHKRWKHAYNDSYKDLVIS